MSGPHPDPLDPAQNLEPAALSTGFDPREPIVAQLSIAVSLKRIADKLEGGHGHELESMFYNAGLAFENGRRAG